MPPKRKRQTRIDYYYPTEFQRMRHRMVARHFQGTEQTDVPNEMIDELQSYVNYQPITLQRFNQLVFETLFALNDNIPANNPELYEQYVINFNNTNIGRLRTQNSREFHAIEFIENNF